MTGYRKMIADRIPHTWDMALRWCKCKKRWIEYTYRINAGVYNNDCMHSKKHKNVIKANNIRKMFAQKSFEKTIDLKNLLQYDYAEYTYWKLIINWVNWFCHITPYAFNSIRIAKTTFQTEEEIIKELAEKYLDNNETLAKFVLKEYETLKLLLYGTDSHN